MSGPPRRSQRSIPRGNHYPCDTCGKNIAPWQQRQNPWDQEASQGRCPDCNHINDDDMRRMIHITPVYDNYFCSCNCTCTDTDRQDDADYAPDTMEQDDVLDNRIDPRWEPTFTGVYGVEVNAVAHSNTDQARFIYAEGHGHHAVATQHDIGIPAESSLVNTENRIGEIEADNLQNGLEPWEAEALLYATGRPWHELATTFPEVRNIGQSQAQNVNNSTNNAPNPTGRFYVACPHCYKYTSDGWLDWLRSGTMTICDLCQRTKRPRDPMDDPDWQGDGWLQDIHTAMRHCMCRCSCDGPDTRQTADDPRVTLERDEHGNAYVFPCEDPVTPQRRSADFFMPQDDVPEPETPTRRPLQPLAVNEADYEHDEADFEFEDNPEEDEPEEGEVVEDDDRILGRNPRNLPVMPPLPIFAELDRPNDLADDAIHVYGAYLAGAYEIVELVLTRGPGGDFYETLAATARALVREINDQIRWFDFDQAFRNCILALEMCRAIPAGGPNIVNTARDLVEQLQGLSGFFRPPTGETLDNMSALLLHFSSMN